MNLILNIFRLYRSTKSHNDIDDDADLSDSVPDEAFYYQEIEVEGDPNTNNSPNPPSPPTLSHRDMARPPHEDPEYQRQLVGNIRCVDCLLILMSSGPSVFDYQSNGYLQFTDTDKDYSLYHKRQLNRHYRSLPDQSIFPRHHWPITITHGLNKAL